MCQAGVVRTFDAGDLRENLDEILDAVAAGETYRFSRDGVEVAELCLIPHGMTAEELVARHRRLPRVDHAEMRREADEFFDTEDRVGDDDPWERRRG